MEAEVEVLKNSFDLQAPTRQQSSNVQDQASPTDAQFWASHSDPGSRLHLVPFLVMLPSAMPRWFCGLRFDSETARRPARG